MMDYKTMVADDLHAEVRRRREEGLLPEIGSKPDLLDTGSFLEQAFHVVPDKEQCMKAAVHVIMNAAESGKNVDRYIERLDSFCAAHRLYIKQVADHSDDDVKRILLVDDSDLSREGLRVMLETEYPGIEIKEAADGREGLHHLIDSLTVGKIPDLVFTDMQMPHMDGLTAAKAMRKAGYKGPIYIWTSAPEVVKGATGFVDGVLEKTISLEHLFSKYFDPHFRQDEE